MSAIVILRACCWPEGSCVCFWCCRCGGCCSCSPHRHPEGPSRPKNPVLDSRRKYASDRHKPTTRSFGKNRLGTTTLSKCERNLVILRARCWPEGSCVCFWRCRCRCGWWCRCSWCCRLLSGGRFAALTRCSAKMIGICEAESVAIFCNVTWHFSQFGTH